MTTSPPMERLWIAAAGRRRREGQALPTSILGGPGPLERLPLLGPEDRPDGTSTMGRSDPTPRRRSSGLTIRPGTSPYCAPETGPMGRR